MSTLQLIQAAAATGLSLTIDGPDLVVESDGPISESLLGELRRHKPEILAALTKPKAAFFSDLYETELDYARALLRFARQDGFSLAVKDGRFVIAIGSKRRGPAWRAAQARAGSHCGACLPRMAPSAVSPYRTAAALWHPGAARALREGLRGILHAVPARRADAAMGSGGI